MIKENRYFVVFFHGVYQDNGFKGMVELVSEDGEYLNKRAASYAIREEYGFDEAIITGWRELSKEEYLSWKE